MKSNTLRRLCTLTYATLMLSQGLQAASVRVLAWNDDIALRKLAIADAKGPVLIEGMHPVQRTRAYQITTGDKPATIQALDKIDKDGKPAANPIIIPPGIKQPLLLLLPDAKTATGLQLLVLEDDAANFPWGGICLINASGQKLAFVYEKKSTALPFSWNPVLVNPGGDNRNMGAEFFIYDEPQRPIYSSVWQQKKDVRNMVFIVPGTDVRLGVVSIKIVSENRRVLEAQQANEKRP